MHPQNRIRTTIIENENNNNNNSNNNLYTAI